MSKTDMVSPALNFQSEHYPASWHGKVPKRVKMAKAVTSEVPMLLVGRIRIRVEKGVEYDCWVNSHGSVAAILGNEMLGLKPYEFEVIEWH